MLLVIGLCVGITALIVALSMRDPKARAREARIAKLDAAIEKSWGIIARWNRTFEQGGRASPSTFANEYQIRRVGNLVVTSGRIAVSDLFSHAQEKPFEQAVPPGEYSVDVALGRSATHGERIAAARLLLSQEPAVRWEIIDEEYAVESGTAAIYDVAALPPFERIASVHDGPGKNYCTDVIFPEMQKNHAAGSNWTMHRPEETHAENMALFSTGLGDDVYDAWWGFSANGAPVALITEFGLEDEPEDVIAESPVLAANEEAFPAIKVVK